MPAPRRDDAAPFDSLFGGGAADRAMGRVPPVPAGEQVRALASRLPAHVRLGTSSWAYPGWRGIVYGPRAPVAALASDGLAAYAEWPLHRTVGLDRAFYASPGVGEYRSLAELVPGDFRFVVKAEQRATRPDMAPDGTTLGSTTALRANGVANPLFLDASFVRDRVVAPAVEGLGARLGPVVLQFPHLDLAERGRLGGAARFVERLAACLDRLRGIECAGAPVTFAVEVRNRELFRGAAVREYASALAAGGAVHGYLQHPTVPAIPEQRAALAAAGLDAAAGRAVVVRWMLPAGLNYEAASDLFEPFDRLQAPDQAVRAEVAELLAASAGARPGFVVINNKAEGSAVRSVEALAAEIAARPPG